MGGDYTLVAGLAEETEEAFAVETALVAKAFPTTVAPVHSVIIAAVVEEGFLAGDMNMETNCYSWRVHFGVLLLPQYS